MTNNLREVQFLQPARVVVCEAICGHQFHTLLEQRLAEVRPDEACRAGNQSSHGFYTPWATGSSRCGSRMPVPWNSDAKTSTFLVESNLSTTVYRALELSRSLNAASS